MPRLGKLRIVVEGVFDLDDPAYWPEVGEVMILTNDRYDDPPGVRVVAIENGGA